MINPDGEVSPIIVTSEFGGRDVSFFESAADGDGLIEAFPFFEGSGAFSAGSPFSLMFAHGSGEGGLVVGLVGFVD